MAKSKTLFRLANVLTVSRLLFAAGLAGLVYIGCTNTLVALLLFVLGELTDAIDGILARRATELALKGDYSRRKERLRKIEKKRYVWQIMDQVADILLLMAMTFYCFWIFQLDEVWILGAAALVAVALEIQVIRNAELKRYGSLSDWTNKLVLTRRYVYLLLIAVMIVAMIWASGLPGALKVTLIFIGVACGLLLAAYKNDRLVEDKTSVH